MKTFLLHIKAKPDTLSRVVRELEHFERVGQTDRGNVAFQWSQQVGDPLRFTLFEQWRTQADLDAHLSPSLIERWEAFQPLLAEPPVGNEHRTLAELAAPLSVDEVQRFARKWFGMLNERPPFAELAAAVVPENLWMRFPPDPPLTSVPAFGKWYEGIGEKFFDQSHEVERIDVSSAGDHATADVVVVWRARQVGGGAVAARATQRWELVRSPLTAAPAIRRYEVLTLAEI